MIFDIVVLVALVISCGLAFLRGLIREVLTILGVVGGGLAAVSVSPELAPVIRDWLGVPETGAEKMENFLGLIPYPILADIIAYGGVFVVVVGVLSVVSHYLAGWARSIGLGALDRTFGVVFGIARAVLLLALLYLPVYVWTDKADRDTWPVFHESRTRIYVEAASGWIAARLPESVFSDMNRKADEAADAASNATRERLQQLDILRRNKAPDADKPQEGTDGYGEDPRRSMQDLILKNINQ